MTDQAKPERLSAGWTSSRDTLDAAHRAYLRLLKRHGSIDGDVANAYRAATAMAVERCETLTEIAAAEAAALANDQPATPTEEQTK